MHPVNSTDVCITRGIVWDTLLLSCIPGYKLWREVWNRLWKTAMNTSELLPQSFGLYVFITIYAHWLTVDGNFGALHCHEQYRQQTLRHLTDFHRGWYRPHIAQGYSLMIASVKMATTWTYIIGRKNAGGWSVCVVSSGQSWTGSQF